MAKTCTVTISDGLGMYHSAVVEGESLYDAAAKGLKAINKDMWCNVGTGHNRKLDIYIHATGVHHWLPLHKVEQWMDDQIPKRDHEARRKLREAWRHGA